MDRRQFLRTLAAAAPVLALPGASVVASTASRALQFRHLHTGERLELEYMKVGHYVPEALAAINRLLRDFRTDEVHAIDPNLLDLLHALTGATGTRRPFEVISGYRSLATNLRLRARTEGVAPGSLHMRGQAIDIRLADIRLPALRDAARGMRRGGVGYYAASDFVHVDTGRIRAW